jgi:hypothetical protein
VECSEDSNIYVLEFLKGREFSDQMSDHQLRKEGPAPQS